VDWKEEQAVLAGAAFMGSTLLSVVSAADSASAEGSQTSRLICGGQVRKCSCSGGACVDSE
jgi:hypothetical protein